MLCYAMLKATLRGTLGEEALGSPPLELSDSLLLWTFRALDRDQATPLCTALFSHLSSYLLFTRTGRLPLRG